MKLLGLASLAACSTQNGRGTDIKYETRIVDTSCQWVRAIYTSRSDMLTDATADQIRAHNETGALHGCWQKKGPTSGPVR